MRNHLRLGCFALTFMLAALPVFPADRDRRFSNADLRGSYGWALDGTFFGTSLDGVRQFTADGDGTLSGEGTINIGDGGLKHTFVCTYSVKANGTGTATCDVQFLGKENFAFVLIDRGNEVRFISTTPGAIIKGVARAQ
jgi:hypothetical protein